MWVSCARVAMQCSQGRLAGDLNADDPPDLILQLQHLVDVGKQAGLLLQALQSVPVIAPASPGQARPSTSSSAERESGTCNPVDDGLHDAEGDPASPEMDIFDDECIWTKSQLKRSMFGGEVSAADADAIQAHLDRASPLFEPSTDCAVCLLEKDDGAHPALFRLPCCSIEVHLACINRCLGSRGIQNVCPACRAQVPDDVARAVLAAFKANKRARGKRRR